MAQVTSKNPLNSKKKNIIGGVVGILVVLIALIMIFGTPSAESVLNDMSETMLQTKSVAINQSYKGGDEGETLELNSQVFLDLNSNQELKAKGNFDVNITSSGLPMTVKGDFVTVGDSKFVKFSSISTDDSTLAADFSQMESQLKDNWIKSRDGDNFSSFAEVPLEPIYNVMPTPFANLSSDQRQSVLAILQDKNMYTVEESSKVEIGGVSAYKYSIKYDADLFAKVEKAIDDYVSYFKAGDDDSSDITTLDIWVNIRTKQLIKMEFEGEGDSGTIQGTMTFSDYNKSFDIAEPEDYSIESELLE